MITDSCASVTQPPICLRVPVMMKQAYYAPFLNGLPVAITKISDQVGKGVVATRAIRKDEVLWSEHPIVAIQHIFNQVGCRGGLRSKRAWAYVPSPTSASGD